MLVDRVVCLARVFAAAGLAAAAAHWCRTAKRLLDDHAALARHHSELLCEARLLALELNKEGDLLTIVRDPTLPTRTLERMLSTHLSDSHKSEARSLHRGFGPTEARGSMRPMAVRRVLSRTKPGRIPTKVIGVCGMSCSGKSTVSSVLQAHAAQYKAHVPLICLDDSFHEWMFDAPARDQPTSLAPPGPKRGAAEA